ncbi:MAG TPA: hypothetical protein VFV33_24790 [Gemmatimonadaceae bacterium]|nr:hypothetical protein [Gemmatimonadaceae bacterium]
MTRAPSLVSLFVAPLNRAGIEYMVTGGVASVIYGHPRLTLDVDLVLRLDARDIEHFAALWPEADFYCPPLDVLRVEGAREAHGHFDVVHHETGMRADIDLAGTDELQRWALQHRRVVMIEGEAVQLAPIEYVIAYKLRYAHAGGSDRHLRDVARMLQLNEGGFDRSVLESWIDRMGLRNEWARARVLRDRGD